MEVYWMQNIYELELRHSKKGSVDAGGKGGARRLIRYRFPSLAVTWLAGHQRLYL
jgi:hypothetical protein